MKTRTPAELGQHQRTAERARLTQAVVDIAFQYVYCGMSSDTALVKIENAIRDLTELDKCP